MGEPDSAQTFKILVASDIHLGYMESDPIRGNDSMLAFEEILSIAKEKKVDFILHGGDLFHDNKPSRITLHSCLSLLRKYCMGDKPVHFEYLSDQTADFKHCHFPTVNYEDPNFNISIPMFSIHGNHDDPTGQGNLCSLDLLHTAGLVNYFGKFTSLDKIQISPLLLQKGDTKLALYGLGSIRDERLHRMFVKKDVSMLRPKEHRDSWFNMFVLHQNRVRHTATSHIPEQFLEDFLDLVVWGHEHECRLNLSPEHVEWNPTQNLYVCQPGSSIATSLSEGESVPKHVGLLQVNGKNFKMESIPLVSVRQFYMDDVVLSKHVNPTDRAAMKKTEDFCTEKVNQMIQQAADDHTGNEQQPTQPLIRLRVDYTGFEPFSSQRFGQRFVDKVANPKNIIHFTRARPERSTSVKQDPNMLEKIKTATLDSIRVEDMVRDYFVVAEGDNQLKLLSEKGMGLAVKEYVDKQDATAISVLVECQLQRTQEYLKTRNTGEEHIDHDMARFKEERKKKSKEEEQEVKEALEKSSSFRQSLAANGLNDEDDDNDNDEDDDDMQPTVRGKGRGRARGRGGRGRGRGRGAKAAWNDNGDDDEEDEVKVDTKPTRGRGSRGGRGARGSKAPVVAEPSKRTIKDMFKVSSSRMEMDDDNSILISDDEGKSSSKASRSSSRKAPQRKRKATTITFDDSSNDDDWT